MTGWRVAAWMGLVVAVMLAGCATTPSDGPALFEGDKGRFTSWKVDGREVFWSPTKVEADPRTGWVDYGGDKVWVIPQDDWKARLGRVWPPGKDLEGLPWTVEMNGTLGTAWADVTPAEVRVTRHWKSAPGSGGLDVTTRVERLPEAKGAGRVHVWGVGQVMAGEYGLIGMGEKGEPIRWFGKDRPVWRKARDKAGRVRALVVRPGEGGGAKVGTMGRWVAAVYGKHVVVRAVRGATGQGGTYADDSSVQLFVSREYWELETLSPAVALPQGRTLLLAERWMVWERPGGMGEDELAAWVDERVKRME